MGKRTLALNLARALLCETPASGGFACGTCASCRLCRGWSASRLATDRTLHPRRRRRNQGAGSDPGRPHSRIDRLGAADQSSRACQGCGDRTSGVDASRRGERAPEDARGAAAVDISVLVAHQAGRVPATLRSRCRRMPAPIPTTQVAQSWLAQRGVASPEVALAQAGGAPLAGAGNGLLANGRPSERLDAGAGKAGRPVAGRPCRANRTRRRRTGAASAWRQVIDWLIAWTSDLARG